MLSAPISLLSVRSKHQWSWSMIIQQKRRRLFISSRVNIARHHISNEKTPTIKSTWKKKTNFYRIIFEIIILVVVSDVHCTRTLNMESVCQQNWRSNSKDKRIRMLLQRRWLSTAYTQFHPVSLCSTISLSCCVVLLFVCGPHHWIPSVFNRNIIIYFQNTYNFIDRVRTNAFLICNCHVIFYLCLIAR